MKRDTRTENEKRADALLCAAKHWQNHVGRPAEEMDLYESIEDLFEAAADASDGDWDTEASAAISEAAGLGFELQNADGSDD